MARRNLVNIDETILKETIKIAGGEGLDKAPAKKIAQNCGITDATIFVYYENKVNLLKTAYEYAMERFDSTVLRQSYTIKSGDNYPAWETILNFAVENNEFAKYISVYRHSSYIGENPVSPEKIKLAKEFFKGMPAKSEKDYANLWYALENLTIELSISIANGLLPSGKKALHVFIKTLSSEKEATK